MKNRALTILTFAFPVLCAVLIILFCAALSNAQVGGGTGGGNPPSEIRRGTSRAQIDTSGNFYYDLTTGKVIRVKSTCTGAAVSAATEASVCYDTTTGTLKISANGAAYVNVATGSGITINATTGKIPKRASATSFTDSIINETGGGITVGGNLTFDADTRIISFNGDVFKYTDGTGPAFLDQTTARTWTLNLQSLTANRTAIVPDAAGTIVLDTATQTLTNKTLTTPIIASFVNATHSHTNAAGGGSLDAAAIGAGTLDANRVPGTLNATAAPSFTVSGAAGAGYVELPEQASTPGTPTNAARLFVDSSNRFSWKGENGFTRTFDGTANTANRIYVLPDTAGTIALTSDIPALGTNVGTFLATPSSANLRAALTDESGTGAALFAGGNGGAFAVTTLNGNIFTTGTYTLTGGAGKTLTFNNSLTFAGTDGTIQTFPATSATVARTDTGQTFSGTNTFGAGSGAPAIINGGSSQNILVFQQAGTDIGALSTSGGLIVVNGRPSTWSDGGSLASPGNTKARASGSVGGGFFISSDSFFGFHSAISISGSPDAALARNAAGKLEIDNGTLGVFRDFIVRQHYVDATNTAAGTTGNQTINKAAGTVNIAAAGTGVTVTDNLVTVNSLVFTVLRTNDATCRMGSTVPAAGSFTLNLTAACTAEVSIGFMVINQ